MTPLKTATPVDETLTDAMQKPLSIGTYMQADSVGTMEKTARRTTNTTLVRPKKVTKEKDVTGPRPGVTASASEKPTR